MLKLQGPLENTEAVKASPNQKVKLPLAAHNLDLPGRLLSTNWNLHKQLWSATV